MKRSAPALVKRTGWPILQPPRGTDYCPVYFRRNVYSSYTCARLATMATSTTTVLAGGDTGVIVAGIETFQAWLKEDLFLT